MGLAIMVIGLAVFFGSHTLVTLRPQRAALIARLGEGPYKGLFALASLVGILLTGYG
ncbi:MAG: NnrU family protein, partial [Rhodomicrobium sp.]